MYYGINSLLHGNGLVVVVAPHVLRQAEPLAAGVVAPVALVRLLARVDAQVAFERRRLLEALVAPVAPVRADVAVGLLVPHQVAALLERPTAGAATKRLLA